MLTRRYLPVSLLSLLLIIQLTPVPVRAWGLGSGILAAARLPTGSLPAGLPDRADLDADGSDEILHLEQEHLQILSAGAPTWESPAGWMVAQSAVTDLDADGSPEVTLLVWRRFLPWPVDEFLPHGGRIEDFHDGRGDSCHIILIGWSQAGYRELWAGSALADPITRFSAADLDGDQVQELITLEGRYAHAGSTPAVALKVWAWNGFGFSSVSSVSGTFSDLALARLEDGSFLILTP